MSSKVIAVYDFGLERWFYYDGVCFCLMERGPGQLMKTRQPHWLGYWPERRTA